MSVTSCASSSDIEPVRSGRRCGSAHRLRPRPNPAKAPRSGSTASGNKRAVIPSTRGFSLPWPSPFQARAPAFHEVARHGGKEMTDVLEAELRYECSLWLNLRPRLCAAIASRVTTHTRTSTAPRPLRTCSPSVRPGPVSSAKNEMHAYGRASFTSHEPLTSSRPDILAETAPRCAHRHPQNPPVVAASQSCASPLSS